MLELLLAAYLTQAAATPTERPPPPSQDQLVTAVLERAPNAHIISSRFDHGPEGTGCGLLDIGGAIEPFAVRPIWRDEMASALITASAFIRDENGQLREQRIEPKPPQWEILTIVPSRTDRNGDGLDRLERNRDALSRRAALALCPTLTAPEGTVWVLEREPDPNPARGARNQRRAAALTNMLFGNRPEPAPATQP